MTLSTTRRTNSLDPLAHASRRRCAFSFRRFALLSALIALSNCAAQTTDGTSGGNTSWLGACQSGSSCASGLCAAGACAESCTSDGDCEGLGGVRCVALDESCGPASSPICAPLCENDADCASIGDDYACSGGACVPACGTESTVTSDADDTPSTSDGGTSEATSEAAPDAAAEPGGMSVLEPNAEPEPEAESATVDAGIPPTSTNSSGTPTAPMPAASDEPIDAGVAGPTPSTAPDGTGASPTEPPPSLDGPWGSPTLAEDYGDYVYGPKVTTDSTGNALAVWRQPGDSTQNSSIATNRYGVNEGWGEGDIVFQATSGYVQDPCLAGNPDGVAVAAWSTSLDAWAALHTPGEGWGEPMQLAPSSNSVHGIDCAIDDAGKAMVVWTQYDGEVTALHLAKTLDSAWEPAEVIGTSTEVGSISLALSGAGNAILLWNDWSAEAPTMWWSRYSPGDGWQEPAQLITSIERTVYYLDVAINDSGDSVAVWSEHSLDGYQHQIWANQLTDGGDWQTAMLLDNGEETASLPLVAIDAAGNAIALWEGFTQLGESTYKNNLNVSHYTPEGGWNGPTLLEDNAVQANLSMRPNGIAIASWRAPYEYTVDGDIAAATYSPTSGWSESTLFANDDEGDSTMSHASINDSGVATVVWMNMYDTGSDIWANRME